MLTFAGNVCLQLSGRKKVRRVADIVTDYENPKLSTGQRVEDLCKGMTLDEKMYQLQNQIVFMNVSNKYQQKRKKTCLCEYGICYRSLIDEILSKIYI